MTFIMSKTAVFSYLKQIYVEIGILYLGSECNVKVNTITAINMMLKQGEKTYIVLLKEQPQSLCYCI